MTDDLHMAVSLLEEGNDTFVAVLRGNPIFNSDEKGVSPFFDVLDRGVDLAGASVADRVTGRAMALLLAGQRVAAVYGETMSRPARQALLENGIHLVYGREVESICNRTGTGVCPMESAVLSLSDPQEALQVIRQMRNRRREQSHE